MNNTIANVPRELLERVKSLCEYWFVRGQQQHMSESEHKTWHALGFGSSAFTELRALLSAPSPAGVGGLEVYITDCATCVDVAPAKTVTDARVVLAQDAQAIIDGLRGDAERLQMQLAACGVVALANTIDSAGEARQMHPDYMSASCSDVADAVDREIALRTERDQQAHRIGELEGLLRDCENAFADIGADEWCERIDAALSADKEGA